MWITVNTLVDEQDGNITDGDVSLRDAVLLSTPNGTINFAPSLNVPNGEVISLAQHLATSKSKART